jgi:hypothetical protein
MRMGRKKKKKKKKKQQTSWKWSSPPFRPPSFVSGRRRQIELGKEILDKLSSSGPFLLFAPSSRA